MSETTKKKRNMGEIVTELCLQAGWIPRVDPGWEGIISWHRPPTKKQKRVALQAVSVL